MFPVYRKNQNLAFLRHFCMQVMLICYVKALNEEMNVPPEYSHCTCHWTEWMNSDSDVTDGTDLETYPELRRNGYNFCKNPVDIQCYNLAAERTIETNGFGVTCSVDTGLNCQLFCDDYKVRVACCYCPPKAIGPIFQIEAQPTGNCLEVVNSTNLQTSPMLAIATSCAADKSSQQWSWVSTYLIKNEYTQQCISTNQTESGAMVITVDCEESDSKQRWSYDKSTRSLSSSVGYLNSMNGRYTFTPSKSHWLAKVDIGTTDLNTMQGYPCKDKPGDPEFGSMSCSFGSYQGSECHFSCEYGYRLPPQAIYPAVCMKNGRYNATTPTCEMIICNPPQTIHENGKVECSNSNKVDSSCIFQCNLGYNLEHKNRQSICYETGEWDNYPPPKCQRIICSPDMSAQRIGNGEVQCTDGNFYNSHCFYQCNEGFELLGAEIQSCLESGAWNGTKPICQRIQCSQLTPLAHGTTTCSNRNYFMSSCQFVCDEGYTIVGSASAGCNSDSTWSSNLPECQRKTCSKLTAPDHGLVSCSDGSFFSSECQFQCDTAYKIEGESLLTCTSEGWNHGSPECIRIVCSPHLLSPVNGEVQCTDHDFFASRCTFSCQTGYVVTGSKVIVCEKSGWNGIASSCQKQRCPTFSQPQHGSVVCHPGNEYGSLCFFNCNEGYTKLLSNSAPVLCTANGQWSGQAETCKRIKCRSLTTLRKGRVLCSDTNNYKSNCTFRCNEGFNLYGATETICDVNGWDAQVPTCGRLSCSPPLSQPADGQIKCTTQGVLSCSFTCNRGFRLIGNSRTHCRADETWANSEIPVCQRIKCPTAARNPSHGSVKCSNLNMYGSQCNYTCNMGYVRVGEQLTHCTDQGTWDMSTPTCERISCPMLSGLNNGEVTCNEEYYYGSRCRFSCDQGYELIGSKFALCQLNSTWSTRLPYCERITCSPGFSNPSNGRVVCSDYSNFGSVCQFHCEEGFNLLGRPRTTCNVGGWSVTKAPSCKKITCPEDPNELQSGTESCDRSNEYQSLCEYECNRGFQRIGPASKTCGNDGQWTNLRPRCQKIKCSAVPPTANGNTVCSNMEYEFGTECVFFCNVNYHRVGNSKVTCQETRAWHPTQFPVCEMNPTIQPLSTSTNTTVLNPLKPSTMNSYSTFPSKSSTNVAVFPDKSTPETLTDLDKATEKPKITSTSIDEEESAGVQIIPIAASIGGVVLLIILCVILIVLWKRRNKKMKYTKRMIPMHQHRYDEGQKLLSNGITNSNRRFPPIPLDRLESEFSRKHADDDKLFREEFSSLPEGHGTRENGGKAMNKEKNRYTNIIPFDHSRVVLPKSNNDDGDYINASYIDGYKHKGKFIAAQGPKDGTINDFWRMVWDQNVTTIIMVTNITEGKESKCALYWPQSGNAVYGDLNVVFIGENHLVDYTIRKFTIQQVRGEATLSMRRNLMQYHFTSWPDFGVPKTPSGMLKFLRKIKHGSPSGYGAIVVHCSAGVGRTGTFISIDALVDMMLRESKIDVYGFVSQMRSQRPEMVQTEQQYIFIYQALIEHHLYGDTEVEATEMGSHIEELNQRMPGNVTGMEHEFKKLTTIRIQKEQMRAGNHPANMRKNRVLLILPYDWNRVILPIKRGVENTDYINASYIDGYRQKDAYIATQGPLPHTVEDFWRLIWESKSTSIVMLTELVERSQAKCEQYWPDVGALMYGDLQVDNVAEEELDNYTTRDLVITSTNEPGNRKQLVRQFHYHGWPETGPPVSGYSMITLVEQVQKQQQTSGNHPITIHCSAGAGRTGAFCALSTALEQVKAEGVLDMFQIVKCLRMQRPHMVQNLEQYEFCYRTVQEYIDSMSEYYNFK